MTDTNALVESIKRSGLKLGNIASGIGVSRYTLSKKIHNQSEFTATEIQALCDILGIESLQEKESIFFVRSVAKSATM